MRGDNGYYVDKTGFIQRILESGMFVHLITRPRRFGKTLFLDTLRTFLSINPSRPGDTTLQRKLFDGLEILQNEEFCKRYMGQFPVLFLSFKAVEGLSFESAYRVLAKKLSVTARMYDYLLDSPRLSETEKDLLRKYISQNYMLNLSNVEAVAFFIGDLLSLLAKHFERPCMLLIDEYDVPLAKAVAGGYYEEMCSFMRVFLSVLKPEDGPLVHGVPVLKNAVLTGCLRVSKESFFTGVNNFSVNTVCSVADPIYDAVIGFTKPEVTALLDYYGLQCRAADVQCWYDGYRFGKEEIYCPWDVLNFCSVALRSADPRTSEPKNYWSGTSGNDILDEFLGFLSDADAERMQTLMDGGEIELMLNEHLTYADFSKHDSEDFWTLLLFTGYLTVAKQLGQDRYCLRIPNEEIRQTFHERIQTRFSSANRSFVQYGKQLTEAALQGNLDGMLGVLEPLLRKYVSVRDSASRSPAENYYHGFLSALLASAGSLVQDFRSNAEAGDGYADIVFTSGVGSKRTGVVLEIKRARDPAELTRSARDALRQIEAKAYGQIFSSMRCRSYYAYGLAFCGKHCEVVGGTLRKVEMEM